MHRGTRLGVVLVLGLLGSEARGSQAPPRPPLSLTTSDGTGLALVSLSARVVVQGPLAFTELHLAFENPENRQREGRFRIDLPPGASVRRLAMKLPDGWQEGEVVERQAARQIYEDYLHRKQDPALLERAAGNRFRARVFPIAAGETKELKLAYVETLAGHNGYRLRLEGLPRIGRLRIEARVARPGTGGELTWRRVVRREAELEPCKDFQLPAEPAIDGLRQGRLALARLRPRGGGEPVPIPSLTVLVDTSASRAAGFARQIARVGEVMEQLEVIHGEMLALRVACFDQQVTPIFEGRMRDFGQRQLQQIVARRALGASDLQRALRWAAEQRGAGRLLLVTDGVVTAGPAGATLRAAAAALGPRWSRRDVLLVGGIRDEAPMRRLVQGVLPAGGVVLDGALPPGEIARRLGLAVLPGLEVAAPDARWLWPRRLDGLQAGDEALVFVELADPHRSLELVLGAPGTAAQRHRVTLLPAKGALLPSMVIQSRIAGLQDQRARAGATRRRADLRRQIVELSTRHRVLSDHTALLVLESTAEYARYGIERRSLADILVVGERGVRRQRRRVTVLPSVAGAGRPTAPPEPATIDPSRTAAPIARPAPDAPSTARGGGGDRDADRIADAVDRCPAEPESYNGYQDDDGCPDRGRVIVHRGRIEILDRIYFESGRARIRPISRPILEAIAATLRGNPQIARLEIQGHTDQRGARERNRRLARGRANAVRRYLVARGVEARRLVARGYGSARPLDARQGPVAWSKNRRVEFHIRQRDDDAPAPLSWKRGGAAVEHQDPSGPLGRVTSLLRRGRRRRALAAARRWQQESPGDLLALVALGRSLAALGQRQRAARAFGSIIDLFPSRADLRRFAAGQLEALGAAGRALALDSYRRALAQRPDHPTAYQLLALTLLRAGEGDAALSMLERGLERPYRIHRPGALRVLRETLGLVAAAVVARAPARRPGIARRLARLGAEIATRPGLRFILTWETDANDVDLHLVDGRGHQASYARPALASGGRLQNDVTNGYGPECFAIPGRPRAFPYRVRVHYFSRGPMGYGLGKVQVLQHDGRGRLRFRDLTFVVTDEDATLDLGQVDGPLGAGQS
jgi:outer membrane protein OmpA-like peptidoglycan-associated protein